MRPPGAPTTLRTAIWYLDQLKHFADRIGIPAAKKLRKDELEKAIVAFLRTGRAASPTERSLRKTGVKDVERGLDLKLRIENYTSNRETKDFIVEQARLMAPELREKSGVWFRLNRWREEQITSGKHPTYGDLVRQYVALNRMQRFEKVPHGRYINFVAEFLAADKVATRAEAIAAFLRRKVGVVFMRVNSKCAHQVRPPLAMERRSAVALGPLSSPGGKLALSIRRDSPTIGTMA